MQIVTVTDKHSQAAHDLMFSHMSSDELAKYKLNNASAYRQVLGALSGADGICFTALINGSVVGYLTAGKTTKDTGRTRYAELREMRVQKEHQRKGIGTLLVKEFIKWAKQEEYERLCVDVYALSDKNIGFYQKFGFAPKTLTMERWLDDNCDMIIK